MKDSDACINGELNFQLTTDVMQNVCDKIVPCEPHYNNLTFLNL